ncbi:hypothetical protein M9Y10_020944 [Tritrichomonas musculus]|uniref:Protein kinase domain-containing protein n=1 Tax=Tritrichomonas musculus TaxID=1915356 RepID=A0ABR2HG24_9EUKA
MREIERMLGIFNRQSEFQLKFFFLTSQKIHKNAFIKYKSKLNAEFRFERPKEKLFKEEEYVILREIGRGSSSAVNLIFYYEEEELLALKQPFDRSIETVKRERQNYLKFVFPFMPKYYGYVCRKDREYIIIEYIIGQTLDAYDLTKLNELERENIMIQLVLIIQYFHSKGYVYRDFKLNNIFIDENKNGILFDFDRLVKINEQKTMDLLSEFLPPEYSINHKCSYETDIYSLQNVIFYLMAGKKYEQNNQEDNVIINEISKNLLILSSKANFNYFGNFHKTKDINKSIYYFTLSANQNDPDAQYDSLFNISCKSKLFKCLSLSWLSLSS